MLRLVRHLHERGAAVVRTSGSVLLGRTTVYTLPKVLFEWDPAKAAANRRTHRVGFAEAVTALEDRFALTREDPDAMDEQRFVTLGMTDQSKLLVVVYAYREHDRLRIISAWKARTHQREFYEKSRR